MTTVKEIERAVLQLSQEELATFREWFEEFNAQEWDKQIEADVQAGKLNKLIEKAREDYRTGNYRELWDIISVRIPGVYAWVCPVDGEASFLPDTVDELIATVRELKETAERAQKRRSEFTEYFVSVG